MPAALGERGLVVRTSRRDGIRGGQHGAAPALADDGDRLIVKDSFVFDRSETVDGLRVLPPRRSLSTCSPDRSSPRLSSTGEAYVCVTGCGSVGGTPDRGQLTAQKVIPTAGISTNPVLGARSPLGDRASALLRPCCEPGLRPCQQVGD